MRTKRGSYEIIRDVPRWIGYHPTPSSQRKGSEERQLMSNREKIIARITAKLLAAAGGACQACES